MSLSSLISRWSSCSSIWPRRPTIKLQRDPLYSNVVLVAMREPIYGKTVRQWTNSSCCNWVKLFVWEFHGNQAILVDILPHRGFQTIPISRRWLFIDVTCFNKQEDGNGLPPEPKAD
ncbi:uncharacterized protein LOC135605771 isoform X1 [Musa acuminata AAA Group]|uniref:uncharacterized protein LOC135605537 isoform X1 n=1 Tax=Musa acuminata AAA Group TaxID=214697 RepID=UPI0031D169F7